MTVIMVMIVLQMNIELCSLDIRFLAAGGVNMKFVQVELLQSNLQLPEVDTEIEHGADEHVAADAAEYIQVKRLHSNSPAASALIWLAANPAPNPLLIFTTVKPLPQLFSMANKAASPPKLAP